VPQYTTIPSEIADACAILLSCHTAPDESSYFGVVYRGETHVKDLYSQLTEPSEPFYTSLALFEVALDEWLPCFASSGNDTHT
jgi:hypothetical protein